MKVFKSIYFRNYAIIVLVIVLSFSVLGASFAGLSYGYIVSEKTERMTKQAAFYSRFASYGAGTYGTGSEVFQELVRQISEMESCCVVVTDEYGAVAALADSGRLKEAAGTVPSSVVTKINNKGSYRGYGRLGDVFADNLYVAGVSLPTDSKGAYYTGFIFLAGRGSDIAQLWRRSGGIFLVLALVIMVISLVASYFATRKQTRPLKEMAQAAHRFGRGDFSVRVADENREDEIGELARAFNKMAERLEKSENSRRDLIANVSHELKTPMTTITGFADGILDGTIPPEQEREYLGVISSETKRLSRLVRGMLDMSRIQSGEDKADFKPFDICEVVRLALVSLESKITSRGLDVDVDLPEEEVRVMGNRDAITQVVYNLIDNAAKFATPGSAIGLDLWKEAGKAHVSVRNLGETIPREELPLIFERFHKSDRSRSLDKDGVGLGLYIVKTILDTHGEDIFVTSQDGATTFSFTLTLADEN